MGGMTYAHKDPSCYLAEQTRVQRWRIAAFGTTFDPTAEFPPRSVELREEMYDLLRNKKGIRVL